jgi:selenophosphate synthetase-related protein
MPEDLSILAQKIRGYMGLVRKRPIAEVFARLVLNGVAGPQLPNYGDDAAVIPHGDGYLLLAADGIYAMGGRPLAMVNVLASGDKRQRSQIVEGIAKGCQKLKVPMVGGHLHPDAPPESPALSVAILGFARKILRSHLARPGDDLVLACDLRGSLGCKSVKSWDANSGKTTEELLARLEVIPLIAEKGLAQACKDISNAGLLGTAAIMMENSGCGAEIDLKSLPRPAELTLKDWLFCFQSYGFVLAVPPKNTRQTLALFRERNLAAEVIGKITLAAEVKIRLGGRQKTLFDFSKDAITGITCPGEAKI